MRTAGVGADDVVVEVGPGLGSLTLGLLPEVARVVAVEIDPVLAAELPHTVADRGSGVLDRLEVVLQDALRLEDVPGPAPTAFVANLPYNVAVPVLLRLLEKLPSLRSGLVMVQAEVADRLAAPPGSKTYGVPSVKAAWYAEVSRAGAVGRTVFWPAPNVDSGLVAFTRREPPAGDRGCRRSPSSTRPSPSAARPCAPRWPAGPARPPRPSGGCARPASTRPPAARCSRSTTSPRPGAPSAHVASGQPPASSEASTVRRRPSTVTVGPRRRSTCTCRSVARRADGFHDLTTVFHAVGLYDEVDAATRADVSVTVEGEGADRVPTDRDNLALRAAALLGMGPGNDPAVAFTDPQGHPGRGRLRRRVGRRRRRPRRLRRAVGHRPDPRRARRAGGAELGSDVPFSLHGGTALGTGRGERLTPVLGPGSYSWVLALADGGLSTPAVYAELDRQRDSGPVGVVSDASAVLAALRRGDAVALGHGARQRPAGRRDRAAARRCAAARRRARTSARSAASSPAPARRSPSSPATRSTPSASRRRAGRAGRLPVRASRRRRPGPGARVVEIA